MGTRGPEGLSTWVWEPHRRRGGGAQGPVTAQLLPHATAAKHQRCPDCMYGLGAASKRLGCPSTSSPLLLIGIPSVTSRPPGTKTTLPSIPGAGVTTSLSSAQARAMESAKCHFWEPVFPKENVLCPFFLMETISAQWPSCRSRLKPRGRGCYPPPGRPNWD